MTEAEGLKPDISQKCDGNFSVTITRSGRAKTEMIYIMTILVIVVR